MRWMWDLMYQAFDAFKQGVNEAMQEPMDMRGLFEPQEGQEGASNPEDDADDLDDGKRYSLLITRWDGEPLVSLPEGVSMSDLLAFADICYEKDYIFAYDDEGRLIFTGMEAVEEMRVIPRVQRDPKEPGESAQPIVQFKPRK